MHWIRFPALTVLLFVGVVSMTPAQAPRDTVRINHPDGGLWKTPRRLVQAGSVELPASHDGFGRVADLAVTLDGGVFVFDAEGPSGPTLLQFDVRGRFVRTIGRSGEGPGEFPGSSVFGVSVVAAASGAFYVRAGERIYCYDAAGMRTNDVTYRDGVTSTSFLGLRPGPGGFYIRNERDASLGLMRIVAGMPYAKYTCAGMLVDSVQVPRPDMMARGDRPFVALPYWTTLEDGTIVMTRTDQFAVTIVPPSRAQPARAIRVNAPPVRFQADERKQRQAVHDWGVARGHFPVRVIVPETKFPLAGLIVEPSGAFWLVRNDVSEPAPPRGSSQTVRGKTYESPRITFASRKRYAGFLPDGTYRGDVILPITTMKVAFGAGVAWAVLVDDDGVEDVVRFVLPK
jgi:hypothetical protein